LMSSALSNGAQADPLSCQESFFCRRHESRDLIRADRQKRYWARLLMSRMSSGKWQDICFAEGCGTRASAFRFLSDQRRDRDSVKRPRRQAASQSSASLHTRTPALSRSHVAIGNPIEAVPY